MLALPALALAGPATDEYSLDLPDAKGRHGSAETPPATDPGALPPGVAEQLSKDPDGKALAAIATADELGAPDGASGSAGASGSEGTGDEDVSALTAATRSIDDPAVAGVLLAVLAIGLAFFVAYNRSRRT